MVLAACSGRAPSPAPVAVRAAEPAGAPADHGGHGSGHAGMHAAPATSAGQERANAADVKFMSMMIGHHAQAIEMSRMAPTNGANPTIRTLAARIINAQQDEIALMQRWLRDRGQAVPEPAEAMRHGMGGDHGTHMAGMLTESQLQELAAARGEEFDRLFLRYMIEHHKGAVTMVDELFASYGAAQDDTVFKLASDISAEQTSEIARMQRMLFDLMFAKDPQ